MQLCISRNRGYLETEYSLLSGPYNQLNLQSMVESLASIKWQETVETAVTRLESQTGLALVGLSQLEISVRAREWMKAKAESRLQSESEAGGIFTPFKMANCIEFIERPIVVCMWPTWRLNN